MSSGVEFFHDRLGITAMQKPMQTAVFESRTR